MHRNHCACALEPGAAATEEKKKKGRKEGFLTDFLQKEISSYEATKYP